MSFLSSTGQILSLPDSALKLLARHVARLGITELKRFTFERIFQDTNAAGGHPQFQIVGSFDIVFEKSAALLNTAETIHVAIEAAHAFAESSTVPLVLRLNHLGLIKELCTALGIPAIKQESVIECLRENHGASLSKLKSALLGLMLPVNCLDALLRCHSIKDMTVDVALKRIAELLKAFKVDEGIIGELYGLSQVIASFKCPHLRICIDPLLYFGVAKEYSGTFFQLYYDDRRKLELIAQGGNFGDLIRSFRFPGRSLKKIEGVNVSFNLNRLLLLKHTRFSQKPQQSEILLYGASTVASGPAELMSVCSLLWSLGLKVDLFRDPNTSNEHVARIAKLRAIPIAIQIKEKAKDSSSFVRVRNFENKEEFDAPLDELADILAPYYRDLQRITERDVSASISTVPTYAPLKVTLFSPFGKVKSNQKSIVMDKAVRALSPLLSTVAGNEPVEVVAHDLPVALLRRVKDTLSENEEVFRRTMEDHQYDREAATKMRELLRTLKEKRSNNFAFLFNYRDSQIELLAFST